MINRDNIQVHLLEFILFNGFKPLNCFMESTEYWKERCAWGQEMTQARF